MIIYMYFISLYILTTTLLISLFPLLFLVILITYYKGEERRVLKLLLYCVLSVCYCIAKESILFSLIKMSLLCLKIYFYTIPKFDILIN